METSRAEGDINLTEARKAWQATHTDEAAQRILEEDARYFYHQALSTPCLDALESVSGNGFTTTSGRQYLDFHGNWVHQLGYGHPKVLEAVIDQLQRMPFSPRRFANQVAVDFAKKLVSLTPEGLDRVLLAPGGTSANGIALKIARIYTGRHKVISFWDAFHGASLDMIAAGGSPSFRRYVGPLAGDAQHVPPPFPADCPFRCGKACSMQCADYLEYVIEKEQDIAAILAEPVGATPYFPPPDYWKRVREWCDRYGILLIFDEIPHGLGRTGKLFAFEHYGVVPDLLVLGKGLGGGMLPLAAVVGHERFNETIRTHSLGHYTHEKNPVLCAAGLATLRTIEEEGLVAAAAEKGAYFLEKLQNIAQSNPQIEQVVGLGLILGIVVDRQYPHLPEAVMYQCLAEGLSFKVSAGNVLTLVPPLTITYPELDHAADIIGRAFGKI